MADQPQEPLRRLLPLIEGGDNEKFANLMTRLLGGTPGAHRMTLGLLIGVQDFLDYGDIKRVELTWLPPQLFDGLRTKHKQDLDAVTMAAEQLKLAHLSTGDAHGARIYDAVKEITAKFKAMPAPVESSGTA